MTNVLFIYADELRADALGCFGNPICQTPNLDRLAAEGSRFDRCLVTQPTCTPSRASTLSGCWPSALRSRMVGCRTPDDPRMLPRVFAAAGYRTASIGKIHLVPQGEEPAAVTATRGRDGVCDYYGFQEVDLVDGHGMGCFGPDYDAWLGERVPDARRRIREAGRISPGLDQDDGYSTQPWVLPPEVHSGEYIAERSAQFIHDAARGDRPFFLHCSFPDPHYPFTVPEPWASRYDPAAMPAPLPAPATATDATSLHLAVRAGEDTAGRDRVIGTPPKDWRTISAEDWRVATAIYYGQVSLLDQQVGRVLDAVDRAGLRDDTIVAFLSDHGDYLGDHGLGGKGLLYESIVRTPLLVRGPGIACQELDGLATTLDLAPSLLTLCGVAVPETMQGRSMADALRGTEALARDAVMTENDDDVARMRLRRLTTCDWTLMWYLGEQEGELYHRHEDPDELRNRWHDPACQSIKAALLPRLVDELLAAVDPRNPRVQAPVPPVPDLRPRPVGV